MAHWVSLVFFKIESLRVSDLYQSKEKHCLKIKAALSKYNSALIVVWL